ncbi:MAG: ATP-grasp domain-containing protein [Nanoarchaeota archaeon]
MHIVYLHCPEEVEKDIDGISVTEKGIYTADKYLIERLRYSGHNVDLVEFSENFVSDIKKINPEFIFNGIDTFDGVEINDRILKQIESTGIPFSGCNSEVMGLLTNKTVAKEFFKKCHARTADYQIFTKIDTKINSDLAFPLILKPVETDSSVGVDEDSVVNNEAELYKKLEETVPKYGNMFAEEYINGREFCVPVIFSHGHVEVFPILEIDFTEHFENKPKILSYKAKWSKNTNAFKNTYSRVQDIEPEVSVNIKEMVTKIVSKFPGTGYCSVDIRYDASPCVLEVNPNCYLAVESDFIKSAKAAGLTSNEFMDKLVSLNSMIKAEVQHIVN